MTESYRKLLLAKTVPFCRVEVTPATVTIDEDCTCNNISVDRTTVAPMARETPMEDNRTETDEKDAERQETHVGEKLLEKDNVANALCEYCVDRIVPHVGKGNNVKYVVHRYSYSPADDTVELPVYTPGQFINDIGAWCGNKTQGNTENQKEKGTTRYSGRLLYR